VAGDVARSHVEEMKLNKQKAKDAIVSLWQQTVKARALCPVTDDSAIGMTGYMSPPWYQARGATYFVNLAQPLTGADVEQLKQIGSFVNRSFVIALAAILEETNVVPYQRSPDLKKDGGEHAQLAKCLRHRFAHGDWTYDDADNKHNKTRALLQKLFPTVPQLGTDWVIPIDEILEPLKDGVLRYVDAS
jgi:hypothetical protein